MIDEQWVKAAHGSLKAFMKERCKVSSQHKLPGREEILSTITAELIGKHRMQQALDQLIAEGEIIVYGGCYYSDHEIDVL